MVCQNNLIGILIIVAILLVGFILYYNAPEGFQSVDQILTTIPINYVCSECLDNAPKYIRMSQSGGVMYVSNMPPSEPENFKIIKCQPYMDRNAVCYMKYP